jgi:hypothetical protein
VDLVRTRVRGKFGQALETDRAVVFAAAVAHSTVRAERQTAQYAKLSERAREIEESLWGLVGSSAGSKYKQKARDLWQNIGTQPVSAVDVHADYSSRETPTACQLPQPKPCQRVVLVPDLSHATAIVCAAGVSGR